jgi:dTDP-4-dehydrorhamnose 3,5-epimerase
MLFSALTVGGAWLVMPQPHADERGFFARVWCANEFADHGLSSAFVQTSISFNHVKSTLRGLHYQAEPDDEVKLVRCTAGAIYDVIVDLRAGSPTHLRWHAETLSADNRHALYIPKGCAHGFITLEDRTEVLYEITAFHRPEAARGLRWNDPALGISWPVEPVRISSRDAGYPLLSSTDGP